MFLVHLKQAYHIHLNIHLTFFLITEVIVLFRENSGGKPLTMNSSGLGVMFCKVLLVSSG